jgi:tetratricopeptide (TPR) repeat protein/DNA-binding HxlR family transcriptional regulator
MSHPQNINYPPEEVREPKFEKKNFEHIILWMLKNNEKVEWSDFKERPIEIAQSTLSNYMSRLMNQGFIKKVRRGLYKITSSGEDRFNELSREKEAVRKLSYPPEAISKTRNYEDIILWMAYNNNYLKWSDFLDDSAPIFINQSSLSKHMNFLMDKNYIRKDDKTREYKISNLGKSEYSRMLKTYDLDRQSILDEESKRIEDITKRTIGFFEKYGIIDENIKFRFLNNVLKLPIERLEGSLDSEEDFNKVLLFLSMNHPDQYPDYISYEEFSEQFSIDSLDLKFNIRQIVDKDIYSLKFFKLEANKNKVYYFQVGEKLEKVLSAITEDHITKFTYLNKLYQNTPNDIPPCCLKDTVVAILEEICNNLFDIELSDALSKFLPEYINYLAYKIETERKLLDTIDKLEGVAWRNIPDVFQSISTQRELTERPVPMYYIDFDVLKTLPVFKSSKVMKLFEEVKHSYIKRRQKDFLKKINKAIEAELEGEKEYFLKAIFLSVLNKYQKAIDLLNTEIKPFLDEKDENSTITYHFIRIYCYLVLGKFNEAEESSKKISNLYPENPICYLAKAMIPGYKIIYELEIDDKKIDQVLVKIDKAISLDSDKTNQARYFQFKSLFLRHLKKYDVALEAIDNAIKLEPKSLNWFFHKAKIFLKIEDFDELEKLIDESLEKFPEKEMDILITKAMMLKKINNFDEALKISNYLRDKYPDNLHFLNHKVYFHIYRGDKKEAIESGKLLTTLDPDDGNYHDSFGEALTEFGEYQEALKELKKAVDLEPYGWYTYNSYYLMAKCYKELGNYDLARECLENGKNAIASCYCDIEMRKEWHEKKSKLLDEIKILEQEK